ncbi:Mov34/MPN/PAD-1 family protein [Halalkalibacter flavus]|uniref:Mov34/MPN/PAD-1 family protein n=1 Tax=Halalkalibacter flavus TaxID=3090668 RepID=UPI003D6770E4
MTFIKGGIPIKTEKIIIPAICFEEIVEHGRSNLPYEVCGLLSGNKNNVQSVWKLVNEIKSDRRYFVGKKVVEETFKQINKQKEKVIAIYHSHPTTKPIPSSYDLVNHIDDEIVMVIISYKFKKPKIKCYRIEAGAYEECIYLIEPTS